MSYDISIGEEEFNYTYNVSGMFYAVYPDNGIREHYGMTGKASVQVLRKLREQMEDNPEDMKKHEPANGWGSYSGALELVNKMIMAAIANPLEHWHGD